MFPSDEWWTSKASAGGRPRLGALFDGDVFTTNRFKSNIRSNIKTEKLIRPHGTFHTLNHLFLLRLSCLHPEMLSGRLFGWKASTRKKLCWKVLKDEHWNYNNNYVEWAQWEELNKKLFSLQAYLSFLKHFVLFK